MKNPCPSDAILVEGPPLRIEAPGLGGKAGGLFWMDGSQQT
jgi:hypothetical protein